MIFPVMHAVAKAGTRPAGRLSTVQLALLRQLEDEGWQFPQGMTPEEQYLLVEALAVQGHGDVATLLHAMHVYELTGESAMESGLAADAAPVLRAMESGPSALADFLHTAVQKPRQAMVRAAISDWRTTAESTVYAMANQPQLRHIWEATVGPVSAGFGPPNPKQIAALQEEGLKLVRGLDATTMDGLEHIIADGLRAGKNPLEVARSIKQLRGFSLTEQQATAVLNYRGELERGEWAAAQARVLHDARFSRPDSAEKIDTMVGRYADRMATHRSENIARTEMLHATNLGNRMVWQKMLEGDDRLDVRRFWMVAPEGATSASRAKGAYAGPCEICVQVPGMNPDGVGMNEPFATPDGDIMDSPLHPSCRCIVFHRPVLNPEVTGIRQDDGTFVAPEDDSS